MRGVGISRFLRPIESERGCDIKYPLWHVVASPNQPILASAFGVLLEDADEGEMTSGN